MIIVSKSARQCITFFNDFFFGGNREINGNRINK